LATNFESVSFQRPDKSVTEFGSIRVTFLAHATGAKASKSKVPVRTIRFVTNAPARTIAS
jgi:hypothetical protein